MPAPGDSSAPTVQPAYGPTLPTLLRRRFGLSPRAAVLVVVGAIAAAALLGALVAIRDDKTKIVHRGEPFTFNIVITPPLRERPARGDELLRVGARAGGVAVAVTVSPLRIPAYGPGTGSGYLPLYAEGYLERRERELDRFRLLEETKQRRDVLPGHQLLYRSGPADREVIWRDALLIPEEPGTREGVLLRMRQERTRDRPTRRGRRLVTATRRAFRGFAPGEDRP